MRAVVILAGLVVAIALTAAVAWNAAEAHYKNCVEEAKSIPDERTRREILRAQYVPGGDPHAEAIRRRVEGCSRLP